MSKVFTISLNPALDYILKFDELVKDETNRPTSTDLYAAGKGVHVSMLLNQLNCCNEAIVFLGGYFKEFFLADLKAAQVNHQVFASQGEVRINLKLIDKSQTECSVAGPTIDPAELEKLLSYLQANVKPGDVVVTTGSLPQNVGPNFYQKIGEVVTNLQALYVLDAFGPSLLASLETKPFLIKPNVSELEQTFEVKITNEIELIKYAQKLVTMGAQNVLVSRGSQGAMLINNEGVWKAEVFAWNKKLVNAAGAGDSMLAGFIAQYLVDQNYVYALKMSIICGSATAYSARIADVKIINELKVVIEQMQVTQL